MRKEIHNMFSLEGPDGSGKTTQIPLIKSSLEENGYEVQILKSPDITILGEFIRKNVRHLKPWLRNQLFLLDIKTTLEKIKSNKDKPHQIYLWDRYIDSFYTSNKEMNLNESIYLVKNLPKPTKTFLLDIDPEYIFSERQNCLDHHSNPDWLKQKVERYRELAGLEPSRFVTIDARLPIGEVTKIIVQQIEKTIQKQDDKI